MVKTDCYISRTYRRFRTYDRGKNDRLNPPITRSFMQTNRGVNTSNQCAFDAYIKTDLPGPSLHILY